MSDSNGSTDRVANYFRMSKDEQVGSIDRQRSQVLPYCQQKGYDVVATFQDEGISGSESDRRPGLQALLAAATAKRKQFDGIVVDDLKRLVRLDGWDAAEVLNRLRKAGVWLETVARGRMPYDKVGRLLLMLESEGGNEQLLDTSRNVLTKHIAMAKGGKPPLSKRPYGYKFEYQSRLVPGRGEQLRAVRLVPDDLRAEIVRTIFRWFASGHTVGWIAAELARRAVPSPTGRPRWRRGTIRAMLSNPAYCGDRAWGQTSSGRFHRHKQGGVVQGTGSRKTERHPQEEWHFTTEDVEALVDRDLWSVCQDRLRQGTAPTPNTDPGAFLLSRVLTCARCKSWLTGFVKPNGKRQVAYVCGTYMAHGIAGCVRCEVREDDVARQIVAELRERLLAPGRINGLRAKLRAHLAQQRSEKNLGRLRQAVVTLEGKLAAARQRLLDVSKDMIPEVEAGLRMTRQALGRAQEALREAEKADPVRDLDAAVEAATQAVWLLEEALAGSDRLALREALRGVLARVEVEPVPYETTTGKTRHKPGPVEVVLRPGSGLELLADVDASQSETVHVFHMDLNRA